MPLIKFLVLPTLCVSLFCSFHKSANAKNIFISPSRVDTSPATVSLSSENGEVQIFETVEVEASFPGGDEGWKQFLIDNINGTVAADKGAPAGKYTVVIQFIVGKDGSIREIKPLTRFGYGMEAEVVRMIKKSPKWSPAQQNSRFVNAYRKQPVTFVVEEEKKKKKFL